MREAVWPDYEGSGILKIVVLDGYKILFDVGTGEIARRKIIKGSRVNIFSLSKIATIVLASWFQQKLFQ